MMLAWKQTASVFSPKKQLFADHSPFSIQIQYFLLNYTRARKTECIEALPLFIYLKKKLEFFN
jgi:hypothetical protein